MNSNPLVNKNADTFQVKLLRDEIEEKNYVISEVMCNLLDEDFDWEANYDLLKCAWKNSI